MTPESDDMASEFLKNKARQAAERIDKEQGAGAYGGSQWLDGTGTSGSGMSGREIEYTPRRISNTNSRWSSLDAYTAAKKADAARNPFGNYSRERIDKAVTDISDELDRAQGESRSRIQARLDQALERQQELMTYDELKARGQVYQDAIDYHNRIVSQSERLRGGITRAGNYGDVSGMQESAARRQETASDRLRELESMQGLIGDSMARKSAEETLKSISGDTLTAVQAYEAAARDWAGKGQTANGAGINKYELEMNRARSAAKKALKAAGYDDTAAANLLETIQRGANSSRNSIMNAALVHSSGTGGDIAKGITGTALGILTSPLRTAGFGEALRTGLDKSDYSTMDKNSRFFGPQNFGTAAYSGVKDRVDWNIGSFDAFDMLYDTTVSGLESALAMVIGGAAGAPELVGGTLLGSSAATGTMQDLTSRGASAGQALTGGIVSGIFENLFEQVSIGQFQALKEIPVQSWKDALTNIGKSMLVNFSEEGATEIANIIYDTLAMGKYSNYDISMREYLNAGMTEAEAKRRIAEELALQVLQSAASGALMGAGFGAVGSAMSSVYEKKASGARESLPPSVSEADSFPQRGTPSARPGDESLGRLGDGGESAGILESAAARLGESGGENIRRAYMGEEDVSLYASEFLVYYEAGYSGQAMKSADRLSAGDSLNDIQKQLAFQAGVMDAMTDRGKKQRKNRPAIPDAGVTGPVDNVRNALPQGSYASNISQEGAGVKGMEGGLPPSVAEGDSFPQRGTPSEGAADARDIISKLKASVSELKNAQPVSVLSGNEFARGQKKLSEQVGDFFKKIGNVVFRNGFGNVILDDRSIRSDIAHGIGRAKAVTFAAVPDVIANGVQIDFQENWKGRGQDSYVFAAPVELKGSRGYVAAVVLKGRDSRFYLHEVVDQDGNVIYMRNNAPEAIKTVVPQNEGRGGSETLSAQTISQEGAEVKGGEKITGREDISNGRTDEGSTGAGGAQGGAGGIQRTSGVGADQQGRGMEAGSGEAKGRGSGSAHASRRAEVQNLAASEGRVTTNADAGIEGGTGSEITVLSDKTLQKAYPEALAEKRKLEGMGIRVTMVAGSMEARSEVTGRTESARGIFQMDSDGLPHIFVQADHESVTPMQIAEHELFHRVKRQYPGVMDRVKAGILKNHSRQELDAMVSNYAAMYFTDESGNITVDEAYILEEIYADAYAGINVFADIFTGMEGAEKFGAEVTRAVAGGGENAAATDRTTGPPEQKRSRESKYRKVSRQEWRQVQRERMSRYGDHFDSMPDTDVFHAHDRLYVVENFDETAFGVLKVIDPAKYPEKANTIWEVYRNGETGQAADHSNRLEDLRSSSGYSAGNTVYAGNAGAGRSDAGIHTEYGNSGEAGKTSEEGNRAVKGVETGQRFSYAGERARTADRYDYSKPFAEQVDDWIAGKIPKGDTLVIGATPNVFRQVGFNALPMTINQSHVDYAINGTKNVEHHIGEALLKQLPNALKKPVAIIASESQNGTSVVSLLPFTYDGNTVVAPVYIDGFGKQNSLRIDSNAVTSIYGRKNAVTGLLSNAINSHNAGNVSIFYLDKTKTTALYQRARVTMPKVSGISDGFVSSIRDTNSPVKPKIKDVTESQQFRRWFGNSKVVNADGTPMMVYHGTNTDFNTFQQENGAYFFSESRDYAESMAEERGGDRVVEAYISMEKPYTVTLSPRKFSDNFEEAPYIRYAKENGYDGVIFENDVNKDDLAYDRFYVVFEPNQIKSATDNIGTFDGSNPDIRYSRDVQDSELEALRRQNRTLQKQAEYWKNQTKTTQTPTIRQGDIDSAAREIIKSAGSSVKAGDISAQLGELYNFIARGGTEAEELTWHGVKSRAMEIARTVIDGASELQNADSVALARDIRSYLKGRTLAISNLDAGSIGDFKLWRKSQFGKMNIAVGFKEGRLPVGTAYQEMQSLFGEGLFPADITHPADQLMHMADVVDSLAPVYANPYSLYMAEAVEYTANEILEAYYGTRETPDTYADRAQAKLGAEKAKMQQRMDMLREQKNEKLAQQRRQASEKIKEALAKERRQRDEKLKSLKQHYADQRDAERTGRRERTLRQRIERHVKSLSDTLLNPTDKKHIPRGLQKPVADLLSAVNLESRYTVGPDGRQVRDGSGTPNKRTQAFLRLKEAYQQVGAEMVTDPDLLGDSRTPGLLDEVIAMRDIRIADMNESQLNTVLTAITAIETSVRNAGKMLSSRRWETVRQAAEALETDNAGKRMPAELRGFMGRLQTWEGMGNLTPGAYMHMLGESGDALFRQMRQAQDRQITLMAQAAEFAEGLGDVKVRQWESETHHVTLGGRDTELSTAQLMALYALAQRDQGLQHITTGGILPDTIQKRKSIKNTSVAEPIRRVTPEELSNVFSRLTAEQVEITRKMQAYLSGEVAAWGNEASMAVYGYEKFKEKNYWPINAQETQKTVDNYKQPASIANKGFTKGTTPKVTNSLKISSIFDDFSGHVQQMAAYSAWLGTSEDLKRIRNYVFRDEAGYRLGTVEGVMNRVHGSQGSQYFDKLMADIAQGVRTGYGDSGLTGGLTGRFKAAAVGGNIRVIIQQPTAIIRALDMINARYLVQAGNVLKGWEKAKKWAPIAQWKDWGYFDISTGRQMKDVMFRSDSLLDKVQQAAMWGAGMADSVAWGQLWNACEAETKARHKELKPGSGDYYRHVAERFTEIVDRTQVVDGILQRSQNMRSASELNKMASSFMAEPTKQLNMAVMAAYDLKNARTGEQKSKARRHIARTAVSLLISGVVNAAAQSVVDAWRDDDRDRKYAERWIRAFWGFTGDEESFGDYWDSFWNGNVQGPLMLTSYFPYIKDLQSLIQGYDVERMDMSVLSDFIAAGTTFCKALRGDSKYTVQGAGVNLLAVSSKLLGLPAATVKKDVMGIMNAFATGTDNYVMQYHMDKFFYTMTGEKSDRGTFMDTLYRAYVNDKDSYELIYRDMRRNGMTLDKIRTGMETRMKDARGVKSTDELEQRWFTPENQAKWDKELEELDGNGLYLNMSAEVKSKVRGLVYKYLTELEKAECGEYDGYSVSRATEKAAEMNELGISFAAYAIFKISTGGLESDKDEDGDSIAGSLKEKRADALEDMDWLTGDQKDELFGTWYNSGLEDR